MFVTKAFTDHFTGAELARMEEPAATRGPSGRTLRGRLRRNGQSTRPTLRCAND